MTDLARISQADGVLEIVWNRPDKKNALSKRDVSAPQRRRWRALWKTRQSASSCWPHEGDSFTSGNDLADFAAASMGGGAPAAGAFIEAIAQFPKPLVAGVRGLAVGVGTTMLLHCDLVFVANEARLTTPFVNLALVPEAASSMLMPARIGHARAFAMFALGEGLTGAEAAQLGLANASLPAAEVIGAAREAARKLALRPLGRRHGDQETHARWRNDPHPASYRRRNLWRAPANGRKPWKPSRPSEKSALGLHEDLGARHWGAP